MIITRLARFGQYGFILKVRRKFCIRDNGLKSAQSATLIKRLFLLHKHSQMNANLCNARIERQREQKKTPKSRSTTPTYKLFPYTDHSI